MVPYQSAPTVYKNMLFIGANVPEQPATGPPGDTRAYDARTGAKMWEFHSVPRAGETGNETWPADGWKDRTGANNWGFSMTVDEARGILYTTYGSPASDFYGGDRKGNDLFGNSVVALDAATGKMKWYFQAVHHDMWDFDLPPAPGLMDLGDQRQKDADPGADRQGRLHVHLESRNRQAHLRRRRKAGAAEQRARRIRIAHAAHSREASARSAA